MFLSWAALLIISASAADLTENLGNSRQQQHVDQFHGKNQSTSLLARACPPGCRCKFARNRQVVKVGCSIRNLQSIPVLPAEAEQVYLAHNSIHDINGDDLNNLQHLKVLVLAGNYILQLKNGTFTSQSKLTHLSVSHNMITELELNVFCPLGNLTYLDISSNSLQQLQPFVFSGMRKLEKLNLNSNKLRHIAKYTFSGLKSLKVLSLRGNELSSVDGIFQLDNFIDFKTSDNLCGHVLPKAWNSSIKGDYVLSAYGNPFYQGGYDLPPYLNSSLLNDYVSTTRNNFNLQDAQNISLQSDNSLVTVLSLRGNELSSADGVFQLDNFIDFKTSDNISGHVVPKEWNSSIKSDHVLSAYRKCSIKDGNVLSAYGNHFYQGGYDLPPYLNSSLLNDYVSTTRNRFHLQDAGNIFLQSDNNSLLQVYFSKIELYSMSFLKHEQNPVPGRDNLFLEKHLRTNNLLLIDLSQNKLSGLSKEHCQAVNQLKDVKNRLRLNLSSNYLQCTCEALPFMELLVEHPEIFINIQTLNLTLSNSTVLIYEALHNYLVVLQQECQIEIFFLAILLAVCLAVGLAMGSAVYCSSRWKFTCLYNIAKRRLHAGTCGHTSAPLAEVFLVYDEDEVKWRQFLRHLFLPNLRQEGITFILGELDFEGGPRHSQSAEAITKTRKMLILLSKDIFDERDRVVEMNLAILHEFGTGNDVIVPVLVEQVNVKLYPTEISIFLQNQSNRLLHFEDTPKFWARLKGIIRHE